jgi:hypothetical protein
MLAIRGSHAHKWLQTGCLAAALIGASLAIADVSSEGHPHGESFHGRLGIASILVLCLQGTIGWMTKGAKMAALASAGDNPRTVVPAPSPSALSFLSTVSSSLSSWYPALAVCHRVLACVGLLALFPLTLVMGILTATGLTGKSPDNLAAHVGFGAGLVAGGLCILAISMEEKVETGTGELERSGLVHRLRVLPLPRSMSHTTLEYCVWLFFGCIILLTQHDFDKPLLRGTVDMQV